jgi:TonB-linked SusC/RagA family outer membrane protein
MKSLVRYGGLLLIITALLASSGFTRGVSQGLSISGTVVADATGEGLPGAEIQVKDSFTGTATDINGKFELNVPNQTQVVLVINYVGYKTVEQTITASTSSLEIRLEEDILRGSEVVVTGLATTVKRRNLANAVGTISADELVPVPAQTLERALSGKVAGLRMTQNTGAPGGGIDVNLRGISTLTNTTQPLYVIDGVIVDNTAIQSGIDAITEATGVGSNTPQGQPTNRIADINPNDIENIEVLKGPSAAAIYGSKANNGVVIISTKQGYAGKTRIDISQKNGYTSILNKIGFRQYDAQKAAQIDPANGAALFAQNGNIDYEELVYGEDGFLNETVLSIRGGTDRTRFYIGGQYYDEGGIVPNTGYEKISGKVNITHKFSDRVDLQVFTNFARSESDRSITGNENQSATTLGFALAFTQSFYNLQPVNGVFPAGPAGSNPLQTVELLTNNELSYRGIGSLRLKWNIFRNSQQNLDFILLGGADFYSLTNQVVSPPELQWEADKDADVRGELVDGATTSIYNNVYFNLAHRYRAGSTIFSTSGGIQIENRDINNRLNNSKGLISGQTNVDQAASVDAFQTQEIQKDRGFYLQEEIDLSEKIYLTLGVRGDRSSSNGDTDKYFLFPKAAASIRLTQYGLFTGVFEEFKVRAAYGETGNLPRPDLKFTSLEPSNISGNSGLITQTRKGLATIEPEKAREIEAGLDLGFWRGRGSLEATFYNQNISDLIIINLLPPSSGFEQEVVQEGNEMKTRGFEIGLGLTPVRNSNIEWTTRLNWFTTESEITKLAVDPFVTGGFRLSLGQVQVKEGQSPSTIVGTKLNASGQTIVDANGNPQIFVLGNETPDFVLGWNNHIRFGQFDLNFLLDWQSGGNVVNLGRFLTDIGATTVDYDTPEGQQRRATGPSGETSAWVEDANYIKMREVGLFYTFPSALGLSHLKLGAVARNLFMITDYTGYDPEVGQFGNISIGRAMDVIPFPSSRQVFITLDLGI